MKVAMLKFRIDVRQPGLDGARILEDVLLIDGVIFGLYSCQFVFLWEGRDPGVCSNSL